VYRSAYASSLWSSPFPSRADSDCSPETATDKGADGSTIFPAGTANSASSCDTKANKKANATTNKKANASTDEKADGTTNEGSETRRLPCKCEINFLLRSV